MSDVTIIGLNEELSMLDTQGTPRYRIYLSLSAVPSEEWAAAFMASHASKLYSRWRKATVEGGNIRVACSREHAQEQIELLSEHVANANAQAHVRRPRAATG